MVKNSKKLVLDKYYTPESLAKRLIDVTYDVIGVDNITEVVEPSAGAGAFSLQIPNCIAYDIAPEHDSIIQMDFLKCEDMYKSGRLYIGNPPFSLRGNNMFYMQFFKLCCSLGDYVAFILPISQYRNNYNLFEFDLVYSEDLGLVRYSGSHDVHCCFNIFKRPSNGWENKQSRVDNLVYSRETGRAVLELFGFRRTSDRYNDRSDNPFKHNISKYVHCMCAWGKVGLKSSYCGEYAKEIAFKLVGDDVELHDKITHFITSCEWDDAFGYPNLSKTSRCLNIRIVRDYLVSNIPELQ